MTELAPIPVISKDGSQGTIVGEPSGESGPTEVLVRFDTGAQVRVPTEMLVLQAEGRYYYLPIRLADLAQQPGQSVQPEQERLVLPVAVEELEVQKRTVETGRVRVHKVVREREELVEEPLLQDVVDVERVVVNRVVDAAMPVRYEGDTMIIPVLEEVLVVEKRLILTEELRVTRRRIVNQQPQHVTLRSEEVYVERVAAPEAEGSAGKDRAE